MKWALVLGGIVFACQGQMLAQPVMVYSEFAILDAQGNVTAPESPREILSPAIPRNAFSTYQIAIQVPPDTPYQLRVGLNPENSVKVTLYRRTGKQAAYGGEILEKIDGLLTGGGPQVVWMDLWVEKDAPVRRIKVEPQLFVNDDWAIYPMEMRVREPQVATAVDPAPRSFLSAYSVLRAHACGGALSVPLAMALTVDGLHYRNAMQDVQLYDQLGEADRAELKKRLGGCSAKPPENPEQYLRFRDYFFTPLWMKVKEGGN